MFTVGVFSNVWLMLGVAAMVGLQLLFTYVEVMNRLFHSAPITLDAWLRIVAVGFGMYAIVRCGEMGPAHSGHEKRCFLPWTLSAAV
jgi:magnesium-transporting ATPase (P-type)